MPRIIGLTGPARSGKDTVGGILADEYGATSLSFAAPIREFVASLLGISVPEMDPLKEVPQDALGGKTPRFAMQSLGTEWGRVMLADDLWVRACMVKAESIARECGLPVVTDVRFDNEAQAIVDRGGVIVRLAVPQKAALSEKASEHPSEAGVSDSLVDETIENNGSIADLAEKVRAIF